MRLTDGALKWACIAMLAASCWIVFILICTTASAASRPALPPADQAYLAGACASWFQNAEGATGLTWAYMSASCPAVEA